MTIIERLQQHKDLQPYKIALIVDEEQYTYGQLYDAIISMEFNNTSRIINLGQVNDGQKNKILLIQSLSFVEQLLQWLWGLYKGYIPMVCHNEMDVAYIDELARIISVEGVPTASQVLVIWLWLCYGLVEPLLQRNRCVQFDGYSLLINIMWTIYMHCQQNYDY